MYALEFLANWLNHNAKAKNMDMECKIYKKEEANIQRPEIQEAIHKGAVAILRVWQDCEHYVLLTKIDDMDVYLFDPYYLDICYYDEDEQVEIIKDRPFEYNRKVKIERLQEESKHDFTMVAGENREIIVLTRN